MHFRQMSKLAPRKSNTKITHLTQQTLQAVSVSRRYRSLHSFAAALAFMPLLTPAAHAISVDDVTHAAPGHAYAPSEFPLPGLSTLPTTTLDGKPVDLATKPGWKVIYFWSAECPCVEACEQYSFLPLAKQYAGKVSFYGVVSGGYDLTLGKALTDSIRQRHLPYSVLCDNSHAVALALNASVTPQTFILDPQNRVVFAGMADDSRRYLKDAKPGGVKHTFLSEALAEALAGKQVSHPTNQLEGCIVAW